MSFSHFPGDTPRLQLKNANDCCTPENMKSWDCGCSWGCPLCWVAYRCRTCDKCYDASTIHFLGKGLYK